VHREGWGKAKRRLALGIAPDRPEEVPADSYKWRTLAAIQQGGPRDEFLVAMGCFLAMQMGQLGVGSAIPVALLEHPNPSFFGTALHIGSGSTDELSQS